MNNATTTYEFRTDYKGDECTKIDVTVDCNGNGEAYFVSDDLCAVVADGEFEHPMRGNRYRILRGWKPEHEVTLEVQTWRQVSRIRK